MLYLYKDVTVRYGSQELITGLTMKIPIYYGEEDLATKYKQYGQSNVYQVGTWYTESGGQVVELNDNWKNLMKELGVSTKLLNVVLLAAYTSAPSQAKKDMFQITMGKNVTEHLYDAYTHTGNHDYNVMYNGNQYIPAAICYGEVWSFQGMFSMPVYAATLRKWYTVSWIYRTDNVNPGKVWLEFSDSSYGKFPTSGIDEFDPYDPAFYVPDAPSGQTGGQQEPPPVSGLVDLPAQPEISALSSGMIQLYNPSRAQVIALGQWLWNRGLDLESLKKIFATPMDVILGLSILPVSPATDAAESVIFGNIDSGIEMRPVSSQYMTKNMGSLAIPLYYNSYLDYEPYTKIELFLPYIGCRTLSADEVMGKTISVDYRIDVLSGACVAFVTVNGDVLYQFGGSVATQIPITSQNYQGVIQGVLGAVASTVGGLIGLGAIAAGMASVAAPAVGAVAVTGTALASSAHNVMSAKQRIDHSGGINGSTGVVGSQYPYVVITRPNWHKAANQPHFTGYPGFFYATVSELSGFTQFVNFEFTRVHATDSELEELEDWFINKGVRLPE